MQNRFGLLDTDMIPMFMIIALDIIITLHFSISCSAVIRSLTIIFAILREATSETYGPRVFFPSYKFSFTSYQFPIYYFAIFYFPIYKQKIPKIFTLPFIYLYQISLLQVTVKGLTTPLSRWVQVVDCLCRYSVTCALSPIGLIPWFANLREIIMLICCITLSPSRENQRKLKRQHRPIKIFVEYMGTNMSIQVALLVINRRGVSVMSTQFSNPQGPHA